MQDGKKDADVLLPTEMIYYSYEGNFQLECDSEVVAFQKQDTKNLGSLTVELFLDKTVMHAQGGGQPTDIGTIECQEDGQKLVIAVDKVSLDRETGVASHLGTVQEGYNSMEAFCFPVGTTVHVAVDADKRRILSECHTAGHVVDSAMAKVGRLMKPSKAYHFLEGPYVEYKGDIPAEERPKVLEELQAAFKELVEEDIPTKIETLRQEQAHEVCNRIADNFDMKDFGGTEEGNVDIRVVTVAGFPCPCGGTHVKSTGELKERRWGITKIQCKRGTVKIKYNQNA